MIYGPPHLGKTPFAKTLASLLAPMYSIDVFYFVKTVDVLPRKGMKTRTPIIVDDIKPGEHRVTIPAHSANEMKALGEVQDAGEVHGRVSGGGNIRFAPRQPRIFTANAGSAHQFFPSFPANLFECSDAERPRLDDDTKALLKRYAFLHVSQSLVPEAVRARFAAESHDSMMGAAAGLYAGGNAIP